MSTGYYASHKKKLLKDFDKTARQIRSALVSRYGEEQTEAMVREAREQYRSLIPDLPYIGGKQPFTRFIIATAWFLAMYRVLQARGRTVEEAGRLVYELTERMIYDYPWFARRLIGRMSFSRLYLRKLKKRAAESHERCYPGDYVYSFIEGQSDEFDWGVDYTECASCKFLNEHGAPELGPYICLVDEIYSEAFGWGLTRTMTLADGYERCDFRFKKGSRTRIESRVSRVGWSGATE